MRRLRSFTLEQPASVREAVQLLVDGGGAARVLAGGTDLIADMKLGRAYPPLVVNLKRIEGLDLIESTAEGTRIGALARIGTLERSPVVQHSHAALWQAARVLASPSVRALATIGGNLGRASPASDTAPPLIVHGARVQVEGSNGSRVVPVDHFHRGPGVSCLAPDEIITAVLLPNPAGPAGSAYHKVGRRAGGWDIAVVGVAAALRLGSAGEVADIRIALASVGPTPLRVPEAEAAILGREPVYRVLAAGAEIAAEEIRPISDVRASASYRRTLARVVTLRTLSDALERARQEACSR